LCKNSFLGLAAITHHLSTGRHINRKQLEADVDLHGDDRKQWEHEQLSQVIDLTEIGVDSAPFQLTSNTSLLKVHSLFSLIGLKRAYVTKHGREFLI
jgi:chloride channel 2